MRIAIVGSGIAGLTAAWHLDREGHAITVYEADDRIGGHTHTVDVLAGGRRWAVDTGFIVYNDLTYPNFVALLDEPDARPVLRQFTIALCVIAFGILLLLAATPLSQWWFEGVSALPADLSSLACTALWFGIPVPVP